MHKKWNAKDLRDEPRVKIELTLEKTYKEIKEINKLMTKAASAEEAKKYVDIKFRKSAWATELELELMRRDCNGET